MSLSDTRKFEIKMWLKEWRHKESPWGDKTDRNGYIPSIMCDGEHCVVCGDTNVARHEVYFGNPDRKTSKACGFWVTLCPKHHDYYHAKDDQKALKKECQEKFEEEHEREEFVALIGKNYL